MNLPHLYLAPPFGVMSLEFRHIFGIGQLESLGYRMALLIVEYVHSVYWQCGLRRLQDITEQCVILSRVMIVQIYDNCI